MLLWSDKSESRDGKVSAVVPRNPEQSDLRSIVLKYQIHNCRPGRCFKKDAKRKLCKYGFPYSLLEKDCLDESGIRYNYARFASEDTKVVSYNMELLKAWNGHINVQRVTKLGLVRYLVKYVSKIEPTFSLSVKEIKTEVEKYFTTRLIGSAEVATTLLSYQIAGGTRQVTFLDTNFLSRRRRKLKSVDEISNLEQGSSSVFVDSFREKYADRPVELEHITCPEYLARWEVFSSYDRIPKSRQQHVYNDAQGRYVCKRLKETIPRWRFLTSLDGEQYYYQQLLLHACFRKEDELISDNNVSKTYKEECFLRDIIKQEEDALSCLEDAAKRNFSIQYIHRIAKMLILQNSDARDRVNNKLCDLGLGEVAFDDSCDDGASSECVCTDLSGRSVYRPH